MSDKIDVESLLSVLELIADEVPSWDRYCVAELCHHSSLVIKGQAARIVELEARLVEAREHAKRGCENYCNWYGGGFATEAPNTAYDLYGYLRLILAAVVD